MANIKLRNPAAFGQRILDYYLEQGWQSLSKRDLELLMFLLLELDGAVDRFAPNYSIARTLRVTPTKVAALRRDAYARWRPLSSDSPADVMKRILKAALTEDKLKSAARYASERRKEEGFLALMVEHPDYREELRQAIINAGAIPIYERNQDVILVHYETLFKLAEDLQIIEQDPKKIQNQLKSLCAGKTDLDGFLNKDVKDLTWQDARSALASASTKILSGALSVGLAALFKIAFPFLP